MSEDLQKELDLYKKLMSEIKLRTGAIDRILERIKPPALAPNDGFVGVESCILQIRFICELIALGAATMHHPFGLTKDIRKSWNAEKTFRVLSGLNEKCFPRAAKVAQVNGQARIEIDPTVMTMKEMQAMYSACGDMLHRGALNHVLDDPGRTYNASLVVRWTSQLKQLLNQHVIVMDDDRLMLIATMMAAETGDVHVALTQWDAPS
jgi:hypothetical protein